MAVYVPMALILAVVMGAILWLPQFRRLAPPAPNERQAVAVYRSQLLELEREIASGKLNKAEGESLRAEIARRLLQADRDADVETKNSLASQPSKMRPLLFALMIPAISIPFYLWQGAPQAPDVPLAARIEKAVENQDLEAMIVQVEKQIAAKPNDAKGWSIIAPVYMQMGRSSDAASAYQQLLRLEPPTADRFANLGEALVVAGEGIVSTEAVLAFKQAVAMDAKHAKASFYIGISLKQEGKTAEARQHFEEMLKSAPAKAQWRTAVEGQIAALAKAPNLSDEQIAAGQNMAQGDQEKMIKGMVDGLEQKLSVDANNIEGWLRLIRARTVLGETDKAKQALSKASQHFQSKPDALASINALATELKLR